MTKWIVLALLLLQQSTTPTLDALIKEIASLRPPVVTEVTVTVTTTAELQTALDGTATIIQVAPGTYAGNFRLKPKATKTLVKGLAVTGRAAPGLAYPKLVALDGLSPVLDCGEASHDYTFSGLEFAQIRDDRDTIVCGWNYQSTVTTMPHDITFDQVWVHAVGEMGRRGFALNGVNLTVTRSSVTGYVRQGQDSQAIHVVVGGPFTITDNYLEGSGENVMFGGVDPKIPGAIPGPALISGNTFYKDPAWQPVYRSTTGVLSHTWSDGCVLVSGKPGSVKNLFELKNAHDITITNNVFSHNWTDAQAGSAILFTVRNQDGGCPWCTVTNVVFACNELRDNPDNAAINLLATDDIKDAATGIVHASVTAANITIKNNLLSANRGLMTGGNPGVNGLSVTGNVFIDVRNAIAFLLGGQMSGFVFTGNFAQPGTYGLLGNAVGVGVVALTAYASGTPSWVFTGNTIETAPFTSYPPGQTMVAPGTVTAANWATCR